jgi:hypothetical protein
MYPLPPRHGSAYTFHPLPLPVQRIFPAHGHALQIGTGKVLGPFPQLLISMA